VGANGTTKDVAENCSGRKFTSAAKSREAKQSTYRSAEALRHPKEAIRWSFYATFKVVPF
jgi:hypothetical protein